MELLQGETLRARLEREGRLSCAATVSVLLPVVGAVAAAHSRGIVHRDLKPDNILLTARAASGVKVLDFGIAKLVGSEAQEEPAVATATGTTLGTLCYMAPEQALGERHLDHRVDVWALGAIAYECLAGERAIKGVTLGQVVLQHNGAGIKPLTQLAPHVPLELCHLIEQMTARMRADRPASLHPVRTVLARHTDADASVLGSLQAPDPDIGAELAGDGAGARAASPEQPASTHPVTVTLQYRVKGLVPGVAWLLGALTLVFAVLLWPGPRTQPASAPRRAARAVLTHDSAMAVRPVPKIASSTASQHGGPLGAGEPYLSGKACEACVSASCAEAAVHCGSDANCSSWLAHTRAHPDPAAVLERAVHPVERGNIALNAAQWDSMHGATTAADAWSRLGDCARDHCLKECPTGRVFGCVGAFDYTRTFPRRVHVRVRVTNGFDQDVGLPGWAVSVCGPLDLRCKAPLATGRTNSAGFLELDARLPSMSTTLPELNGYFLMDGGPKFLPLKVEGTPPILDGTLLHIPQVTANAVESFYEAEGKIMNRELGLLSVVPFDCLGHGATNVTVDVWVNHAERYERCDGICGVVYQNDTGVPDRSRRQLSGRATQAFVHGVPAREVAVVVRDSQTARLVGIERVIVRSGYVHLLLIYPPSRAQFADIPDVVR